MSQLAWQRFLSDTFSDEDMYQVDQSLAQLYLSWDQALQQRDGDFARFALFGGTT